MRRCIIGLTITAVLLPLFLFGLLFRAVASSRKSIATVAVLLTVASLSGCAAILEHDSRSCHSDAVTVAEMLECQKQYPQHNGTITDKISQPVGELERIWMHRKHNHKEIESQ